MQQAELEKKREKLKLLLGMQTQENDALLEFALEQAEEMICSFCNRSCVPDGLYNTQIHLALDLYRAESLGSEQLQGAVKQITEGDMTISYTSAASGSENLALAFLKDYKSQLMPYRKLGW